MRVFRICRRAHAKDPLSGRGALGVAGRWHTSGRAVLYTSGSRALAALEVLAHVDQDLAPADLVLIEIDVPPRIPIDAVAIAALPKSWHTYPAPPALRLIGDRWLRDGNGTVLRVPSAVIPQEPNYLLNPAHEAARSLRVVTVDPFTFDPRLG